MLQVGLVLVDRWRYGVELPTGKWVAIGIVLVAQAYLVLAPERHAGERRHGRRLDSGDGQRCSGSPSAPPAVPLPSRSPCVPQPSPARSGRPRRKSMRRRLVRPTTVAAVGVLALASATACTAGSAGPVARATTSGRASGTTPGQRDGADPDAVGAARRRRRLRPLDPRPDAPVRPQRGDADARPLPDPDEPRPRRPDEGRARDGRVHALARGPLAHPAPAQGARFSDGTPVTTDDVLFTLERAQGAVGSDRRRSSARSR